MAFRHIPIPVTTLKPISVLYPGDIYDIAVMLLRIYRAQHPCKNGRPQPTVHGVASKYSMIAGLALDYIENIIRAENVNLMGIVVPDHEDQVG